MTLMLKLDPAKIINMAVLWTQRFGEMNGTIFFLKEKTEAGELYIENVVESHIHVATIKLNGVQVFRKIDMVGTSYTQSLDVVDGLAIKSFKPDLTMTRPSSLIPPLTPSVEDSVTLINRTFDALKEVLAKAGIELNEEPVPAEPPAQETEEEKGKSE